MTQIVTHEREGIDQPVGVSMRQGVVLALSLVVSLGFLIGLWFFARPLALVGLGIVIGEALSPLVD